MVKIKQNIKSLYAINLVEGEGVGTAYEYYAKLRKLKKFVNSIPPPKKILIAGLPEKYGCSMDFFLLGNILQAETVVIDERSEALEKAEKTFHILQSKDYFVDAKVSFFKIDRLTEFNNGNIWKQKFDLALCSEVLQRLDSEQKSYLANVKKIAKNLALFAPNRGNKSHADLSGLKSIFLEELLKYFQEEESKEIIYDYGYIDMPPFPPGLNRSPEKRAQAAENRLESFLMKGLEIYNICENIFPKYIKKKIAHIVYVMSKIQP